MHCDDDDDEDDEDDDDDNADDVDDVDDDDDDRHDHEASDEAWDEDVDANESPALSMSPSLSLPESTAT